MAFLAPVAGIAGLGGAAIGAIGTIEGGEATQNMAAYQAQVAKNNQIIANQNAQYANEAGEAQAAATSLKGAAVGGKIKAGEAANNIDVNSGSAVNVQQSQREQAQLDTETVVNNAFPRRKLVLSVIDSIHWIVVVAIEGAIIGALT